MNPDLSRERSCASFIGETLTCLWNGGEKKTKKRRHIENVVYSDPLFDTPNEQNLTREQLYSESIRRHILLWNKVKELNLSEISEIMVLYDAVTGNKPTGLLMHDTAFLPMLLSQSTDSQLQRWFPLLESHQMIGSYAQTELGHGTFVRGLETTATFDPETNTFILDTPTLTATKWWIGSLGKSCNFTVLLAQLYTKGTCHGVHAFLVQVRDMETHEPLPGVTVGDIGPKLGFNSIDNGFLRLTGVRIPRENMLMKHTQVLEDGSYVRAANDKLIYSGMLGIRANLPLNCSGKLAAAVTIAMRYSCVRRQSTLKPNAVEAQILDYQTQQHKLFPALAAAFAYRLTAFSIVSMFHDVMDEVATGQFKRLIELHALSAGMKAVITTRTAWNIEVCRLACGGHGYSLASGLPQAYCEAAAIATAEGEATILLLQTARYLMKNCLQLSKGSGVDSFVAYLKADHPVAVDGHIDLESFIRAFESRTSRIVLQTASHLQSLMLQPGMTQETAWNLSSVQLMKAAIAHIDYVLVRLFVQHVSTCTCDSAVKEVLIKLCKIYAINIIFDNAGDFVQAGFLTSSSIDFLQDVLYDLYTCIRPDAIAIVDSFEFHDKHLNSALGAYDGLVYENLYRWAGHTALNDTQRSEQPCEWHRPCQFLRMIAEGLPGLKRHPGTSGIPVYQDAVVCGLQYFVSGRPVHDSFHAYLKPLRHVSAASSKL